MSLFSFFSKQPPEATSVAQALAGNGNSSPAKGRKSERRQPNVQEEQLVPEKKRARRRLIGAVAMVLAVVTGLPMVLDSEPKPLNKNIQIQIPSKEATVATLDAKEELIQDDTLEPKVAAATAAKAVASKSVATTVAPATAPVVAVASATPATPIAVAPAKTVKPDTVTETRHVAEVSAKKETKKEIPVAVKPEVKIDTKLEAKAEPKPSAHAAPADDSARALAILEGTTPKPATHMVVQVGAFATQEKVDELQGKLTAAGIKSFTQKVATSSGDKIRVRVGPFTDKAAADKMKAQLEKLGLNGSLIPL